MNKPAIKKWLVLGSLLLLTLVLVWKAPEPEHAVADSVKPVLPQRSDMGRQVTQAHEVIAQQNRSLLKPRMLAENTLNLFAMPTQKVKPIVKQKVKTQAKPKPIKRITIPFDYIGMLGNKASLTVFLMSGESLYLVKQGDVVKQNYQLVNIDMDNEQLEWLHLPSNETHKLSMKK